MMKYLLITIALCVCATIQAQTKLDLQQSDTVASVLQKCSGQTVELRMKSGEKIGGKLAKIGDKAVMLTQLTGMEYYDAVVDIADISAVMMRAQK